MFNLDDGTLDTQLFSINLTTGAATYVTTLDGTFNGLTGVAAVPEPASYAMVLLGLGLMAGAARRQKRQA
ncbi:PEP-CTERM sorting domain-containing protein [Methylophilus medardicus]|uniref:PEP-CTERM sorting domain-containing protein n=1 Tax=Methylophilus medardicus TaxID=2588534 RepID=A0A5B8CW24_9PROT|nr:PEP-CTERM sorting domain-containing protein [Methylophilus medardicus]QDC50287.1 PEP-CTERM sorting domain-containing protein [Methylophilus medardicus]QDC53992.1 PEP-CTERM sorting domain-containing protein [Methylophilus medardicus]